MVHLFVNRRQPNKPTSSNSLVQPTEIKQQILRETQEVVKYTGVKGQRDWGGRVRTAAEQADFEERNRGWGNKPLRAAYYATIGDAPMLTAGDRAGAAAYLEKIAYAIAMGGWTATEWRRLNKLHLKWWKRAKGEDPYFEVYGNKRQWADHGSTAKNRTDKETKEKTRGIKEVIRREVNKQRVAEGTKVETFEERAVRLDMAKNVRIEHEEMD